MWHKTALDKVDPEQTDYLMGEGLQGFIGAIRQNCEATSLHLRRCVEGIPRLPVQLFYNRPVDTEMREERKLNRRGIN